MMKEKWWRFGTKYVNHKVTGTIEEETNIVRLDYDISGRMGMVAAAKEIGIALVEHVQEQKEEILKLRREKADLEKIKVSLEADLGKLLRVMDADRHMEQMVSEFTNEKTDIT